MTMYKELFDQAPSWRNELEAKLKAHGGNDLVVSYTHVAHAFPAREPNPRSFDTPLIDSNELKLWSTSNGWLVQYVSDITTPDNYPAVRFTKLTSAN